ncbi:MAG: hypothetical protein ABIL72_07310, partial [candidate division WOR-3 bacterium]
ANYPRFEANPNNGGPFKRDDPNKLIATNRIYHNSHYPSYISLPIYQTTDIKEAKEEKIYYIKGNRLCTKKMANLYSANGRFLKKINGCEKLNKGVYILKVKNKTYKVIML